jgi:hypothetical protein
MNNNTGNRLKTFGYVLFGIAMLAAYGAVSTMGFSDIQGDITKCQEMMELWVSSEGQFGWPNCDHLK